MKYNSYLLLLAAIMAGILFTMDMIIPLGVAFGVCYIIVILITLQTQYRHAVIIAAITSTLLVFLGYFFSPEGGEAWQVYFNRIIAVIAIWFVALQGLIKNELNEANKNLDIKTQQQLTVAQIGQLALSGMHPDELMNVIVTSIAEMLNVRNCGIFRLSKDNESMVLCADIGWHDGLNKGASVSADLDSQVGYTLLSNEPVIVDDLRTETRFNVSQLLHDHKMVSGISVKISGQQGAWGVLSAHTDNKREFTREDINFLLAIANSLAEAIQRKAAEDDLSTSEEQFKQMVEHIDEMLWLSSADGMHMLYVSPAYEKISGRSCDEFYKDPNVWLNDIHPDDLPRVIKNFVNNGIEGKPYSTTFRICRPDGEIKTVCDNGFPIFDQEGKFSRIAGTLRDITEQKKADDRLDKLRRRYEYILQSAGEGIIGLDMKGNTAFLNPAACKMLGWSKEEITGKNLHELVHHSHTDGAAYNIDDCPIYAVFNDEEIHKSENESFWRKDDTSFPVEYVSTPICDANKNIAGAVVMFRDISERKQMETELQMAQKLEAVGQLAAGIAHEINTPAQYVGDNMRFLNEGFQDLVTVLNQYKNLLNATVDGTVNDEHVKQVKDAAVTVDLDYLLDEMPLAFAQSQEGIESISNIVRAMKEFSHPGSDDKDIVDINHIIENTVTVTKNEWKYVAEIKLDLEGNQLSVPCYAQQMGQVFMNLIVNAAHAIGDVIDNSRNELGTIIITSRKQNEDVEIRITDTGRGIPEKIRKKIFDPFFTTKGVGKGTGQGLAIARSAIIDKHSGTIKCESKEGIGTTFIISLPLQSIDADLSEVAA